MIRQLLGNPLIRAFVSLVITVLLLDIFICGCVFFDEPVLDLARSGVVVFAASRVPER